MATFVLGSPVRLQAIFWDVALRVTADPATGTLATAAPHGLANGDVVIATDQPPGDLDATDAFGQTQPYVVANVTATTFRVELPGGAVLPLRSAAGGVLYVGYNPPAPVTCAITLPSGATANPTPTSTLVSVWTVDYDTTERGAHEYAFAPTGRGGRAKGTFYVE